MEHTCKCGTIRYLQRDERGAKYRALKVGGKPCERCRAWLRGQ